LQVTVLRRRKVVRLAFVGLPVRRREAALWYAHHHGLARVLSRASNLTVHTYIYDPAAGEQVIAYGNGRRVGGEQVLYEDVELSTEEEEDDAAFTRIRARWPMGHLAYVFGVTREELLGLPRAASGVVLSLDAANAASAQERLDALLPGSQLLRVTPDAA
jgi:hypothetical protein